MRQDAVKAKLEKEADVQDKDELKKKLSKKLLSEEEDAEDIAKSVSELGLGTGGG